MPFSPLGSKLGGLGFVRQGLAELAALRYAHVGSREKLDQDGRLLRSNAFHPAALQCFRRMRNGMLQRRIGEERRPDSFA